MKYRALLCVIGLLGLFACSDKKDDETTKPPEPVDKLYNDAVKKLKDGDYKDAIKGFQEVERQHGYSPWALHAEIMAAYAEFRDLQFEGAIGDLDRFVKQHPTNSDTPY